LGKNTSAVSREVLPGPMRSVADLFIIILAIPWSKLKSLEQTALKDVNIRPSLYLLDKNSAVLRKVEEKSQNLLTQ